MKKLEEFILDCKAYKQHMKDNNKRSEKMYESLHKEACLHASYGDMYKPTGFFIWKRCPVCNSFISEEINDFKTTAGSIYIDIYTCNKCEYKYVYDSALFGKELQVCMEKEIQ